nr:ribonuclease H-like domain-containing protein [Tanacetum cinerariifolium]
MVVAYKEGLKYVEQRLEFFKTNESKYIEQINVLKIDIHCRDRALTKLQRRLDLVETKKGIQLNVNELENASKSLNKVIECQIVDNCKKGLGYNAVPPPHTGLFPPLKSDLSSTGDAPIIKDWVSDDEEEEVEKQEVKPSINRINFVKATTDNNPKETVKTGEQPKQNTHRKRAPTVNAARRFNAAHPKRTINAVNQKSYFSKQAHSSVLRPNKKLTAIKNSYDNKKVKTIWVKKVNTAKLKAAVNAAKTKAKYNVVKGKSGNAIKASTCWVWKTKHNVLDHVSRHDNASITLKKFDYVDARGYEEIDEGYVAFGRNLQGGKITGKGKIKTRKLDFKNVYFVRELKFNLFNVSQICNKKNSVLFTNTECIVLSPDFKLIDKNQILLRVSRQNNMYIIDLKNIVPIGDLTCLFAKATEDESKL